MNEFDIKLFWERVNLAYAELKKNPIAWKKEQEERLIWKSLFGFSKKRK